MQRPRLLIIEDDPTVAEWLLQIAGSSGEVARVDAFAAGEPAIEALERGLVADIAIVDLGLPGIAGHHLIRRLASGWPDMALVVHTVHEDDDSLFAALRSGATGYLLKGASGDDLLRGLREAAAGGAPMSPGIARRVIDALRPARTAADPPDGNPLTPRERDVLDMLARGFTYENIGCGLGIATSTVQGHIKSIYKKLEVASKAEATSEAFRRGLLT